MGLFNLASNYFDRKEALANPTDRISDGSRISINGNIQDRYASKEVINWDTTGVKYRNYDDFSYGHRNSNATMFKPFSRDNLIDAAKSYIGIKNNRLVAGHGNEFKQGDLVSPTYSNMIKGLKTDANGNVVLEYGRNKDNPNKYVPLFELTNGKTGSLNMLAADQFSQNRYGGIQGGSVLMKIGNHHETATGSIDDIHKAIEDMKSRYGSDSLEVYSLDNGSFVNGLKKTSPITPDDLRKYNDLNSSGGTFIYTTPLKKHENNIPSFLDVAIAAAQKHGVKIGETGRSMEQALHNYRKGTSKTLLSQHLTGNAIDLIKPTDAQSDSILADIRKVYPNAEDGRKWTTLYDPYHIQSNAKSSIKDNVKTLQEEYVLAKQMFGKDSADKMFQEYTLTNELPVEKQMAYNFGYPDNTIDKVRNAANMIGSTANVVRDLSSKVANSDIVKSFSNIYSNVNSELNKMSKAFLSKNNQVKVPLQPQYDVEQLPESSYAKIESRKYTTDKMPNPPAFIGKQAVEPTATPSRSSDIEYSRWKDLEAYYRDKKAQPSTRLNSMVDQIKIPLQHYNKQEPLQEPKYAKLKAVASKQLSRSWQQADTDKINQALGTKMTTADRVELGRKIYGKDYRGTKDQNAGIVHAIRSMENNIPTANPRVIDSLFGTLEPVELPKQEPTWGSEQWIDNYINNR